MKAIFYNGDIAQSRIGDIISEIYLARLYEPVIKVAKWQRDPSCSLSTTKQLTIVDVGANIGLTVAYFADYAKRVIAVEPCAAHIECLQESKEFNQLENVSIQPCGIFDHNGIMALRLAGNPTAHTLIDWNKDFKVSENVDMITIGTLMDTQKITTIDILKLDAEGAESEIIRSESFKQCCPNIRYIIGEWHAWTMLSQDAFRRTLIGLGYHVAWLAIGEDKPSIFVAWREGECAPEYGVTK